MARVMLGKGFLNLQEGPNQVLQITNVDFDPKYQKAKVTFEDERGGSRTEQFMFLKKNGKPNDVALNIFTNVVVAAFDDPSMRETEIDPEELEGRYVVADVVRNVVENEDTGRTNVYMNVTNYRPFDGDLGEEDEEDVDTEGLFN